MKPLSVLIVEDQQQKISKIIDLLLSLDLYNRDQIDVAQCGIDARQYLRKKQYDLLILDVVLPNRPEEQPRSEGGVELLREVMSRDSFVRPRYILGLTAFPEVFQSSAEEFADYTWAIIQYEDDTAAWHDPIKQLSRHIFISANSQSTDAANFDYDFCVVTALPLEFDSVVHIDWGWEELRVRGDPSSYKRATIDRSGKQIKVIAACASRMGMVSAAVLSANMIRNFRPRIIASLGICAGIAGRVSIGDVVVADPSWDYQSGKLSAGRFEFAPHQLALNSAIRRRIAALFNKPGVLAAVKSGWCGPTPLTELRLHVGPFASGSAVLADTAKLQDLKLQHRQLIAIDMEVYGVYAAAAEACIPSPFPVAIKGISDYGDEAKGDAFREYASYTSARVFSTFVTEEYPNLVELLASI